MLYDKFKIMENKKFNYSNIVATLALLISILAIYIPEKNRNNEIQEKNKIELLNLQIKDSVKIVSLSTLNKYKKIINTKNLNIFSDKYQQLNDLIIDTRFIDNNVIEIITTHKNKLVSWQTKKNTFGKITIEDFSIEVSELHEKCQQSYYKFCKEYSIKIDPFFFKKAIFY